jgi:hypothetical protein
LMNYSVMSGHRYVYAVAEVSYMTALL